MNTSAFNQRIIQATTVEECQLLTAELQSLLDQAKAKQTAIEAKNKNAGLRYRGPNATTCSCGNSVQRGGQYSGRCGDCNGYFCVECLSGCEECGKRLCNGESGDDPCITMCDGCEDVMLCSDCSNTCEYCHDKRLCSDCPKEIYHYNEVGLCPDCYDYMVGSRY